MSWFRRRSDRTPPTNRLADGGLELSLEPGQVVVRQGDPADAMFVVVSGRLRVSVERDGSVDRMPDLVPGDCFGEIGLLGRRERTATVTATETSTVLRIDGGTFLDAVSRGGPSPALQILVAERLARGEGRA